MANGRCRFHGGKSTGPRIGSKNALKHGRETAAAKQVRREATAALRAARQKVRAAVARAGRLITNCRGPRDPRA
jgi:hypothetical protein